MRTNNLLATGGMMQEGGTVDPVSGNNVPTGSLKEEVRDDIPAQLSPGEFVFPADVTRYIGLDKLMQIREAAKEGLKEMDSKGQMGNSEEVADDVVDEDKFSTNIDEIISGLNGAGNSEPKEFAEGGVVKDDPAYKDAPIKGFKMVQYEDVETKAVKYIPFINGKPLLPVPKGYTQKKAAAPVTPPPATTPVVEQPLPSVGGGGGGGESGGGGRSSADSGGGSGTLTPERDTGVEGFGDIQGGTNRNLGRAAGFVASLANPIFGLLVSAGSQYAIKVNNEKVAAANAAAIDASALAAAGFNEAEIARAKEAAAKATMEGKSAKDIAVAAANAAGTNTLATGTEVPKTTLDALVGITNGWNTANKEVMAMPPELAEKVEPGTWNEVVKAIEAGLTPEQAVQKVAETSFAKTVDSYFTGVVTTKEAEAQIAGQSEEAGGVPAGEYNNVLGLVKEGYSVKEAIDSVTMRDVTATDQAERTRKEAEAEAANQRSLEAARAAADAAEAADRAARQQEASEQATRDREAADREAANQRNLEAARAEADRAEAADRAARQQEAADQTARAMEAANREAENQRAVEAARAEADRAEAADRAARQQEASDQAARDRDAADREAANQRAVEAARAEADAAEASRGGGSNQNDGPTNNATDGGWGSRDAGGDTSGGGGGGGGGGRVICTHFYRKGEMSRDMWRSDLEFTFKHLSPTTVRGYQYWGIPYVKLMRKSRLAENIMRPIAIHRAKELSYQMGRSDKGSLFGKLVRVVAEPICFAVGLFVREQNWESLWESNNKTTYNINI